MKHFIEQTNGKIFSIDYTKKDGTKRKIVARIGVKKGLVGSGRKVALKDNQVTIWDVQNNGYRTIDCDMVGSFKCGLEVVR